MIPRIALGVAGLVALALGLPTGGMFVVTVVGVAALVHSVYRPGSTSPALVIVAAVVTWLATPATELHDVRLVGLALAISVVHASASLAAVVPARARVPVGLVLRWAAWATAAAFVGVGVLGAASLLPTARPGLLVTTGAVIAAALGGVLLVAFARRLVRPT